MDLKRLVELSFKLEEGMEIGHSDTGETETIYISDIALKFNGCYSTKNSTVCFVMQDQVFVTPLAFTAINILDREGAILKDFDYPLSNGLKSFPIKDQEAWEDLVVDCYKIAINEYQTSCKDYCHRNGIMDIDPNMIREFCFEIKPDVALLYAKNGYIDSYKPIASEFTDAKAVYDYLGTFCVNQGIIVFVYSDGREYVGKAKYLRQMLFDAGYSMCNRHVPLSSNEHICDVHIRNEWLELMK